MKKLFATSLLLCLVSAGGLLAAVPQQINYQGYLTDTGGNPLDTTVAMTFTLYTDSTAGSLLWTETRPSVTVTDGLFNVRLGQVTSLGDAVFNNPQVWLGITAGNNSEMTPRSRIVSVGYAYRVGTVDGATGGMITGDVNIEGKANIGSGNSNTGDWAFVAGMYNTATGDYSCVNGGYNSDATDDYATVSGGQGNQASGLRSTVGGGDNNEAMNTRATIGGGGSNEAGYGATVAGGVNNSASGTFAAIGGGQNNTVTGQDAVVGGGQGNTANQIQSTVSGGLSNTAFYHGSTVSGGQFNTAYGLYSNIGGGSYNAARGNYSVVAGGGGSAAEDSNSAIGNYSAIGGGRKNTALDICATVSGGHFNSADTSYATVGGGQYNRASGSYATVGGGQYNPATGSYATVSGGYSNSAEGEKATVPGGGYNWAQGNYSFAAGYRAKANHNGCFVWADNSDADLTTSYFNQIRMRGAGGTIIYSNAEMTLGVELPPNATAWIAASDSTKKPNIRLVDTREILDKISQLPIKQWSYKSQDPSIEHIGPMAQDFYKLFHLGEDSLGISTIDPDGIALAAIQELQKQNAELKAQNDALRQRLERVEFQLQQLTNHKITTTEQANLIERNH